MRSQAAKAIRRAGGWLQSPVPGTIWIEYAFLAFLVAVAAMGAVQAFGGGVAHLFQHLLSTVTGVG